MIKYKLLGSISAVLLTFLLYILSLIKVFPLLLSIPLLFGAVLLLVFQLNHRRQFKGFRS